MNPHLREEFPITKNYNFLNHASLGPIPLRTVQAVQKYLELQQDNSYVKTGSAKKVEQVRRLVAEFIGANTDEIAFTKSTAEGSPTRSQ